MPTVSRFASSRVSLAVQYSVQDLGKVLAQAANHADLRRIASSSSQFPRRRRGRTGQGSGDPSASQSCSWQDVINSVVNEGLKNCRPTARGALQCLGPNLNLNVGVICPVSSPDRARRHRAPI